MTWHRNERSSSFWHRHSELQTFNWTQKMIYYIIDVSTSSFYIFKMCCKSRTNCYWKIFTAQIDKTFFVVGRRCADRQIDRMHNFFLLLLQSFDHRYCVTDICLWNVISSIPTRQATTDLIFLNLEIFRSIDKMVNYRLDSNADRQLWAVNLWHSFVRVTYGRMCRTTFHRANKTERQQNRKFICPRCQRAHDQFAIYDLQNSSDEFSHLHRSLRRHF